MITAYKEPLAGGKPYILTGKILTTIYFLHYITNPKTIR
jgi:hypothetical protein